MDAEFDEFDETGDADIESEGTSHRTAGDEALKHLIDNDTILIEGIMLPPAKDGPLTADKVNEVIDAYSAFRKRYGITHDEVARGCGYSSDSTISEWAARKSRGDISTITRRVNSYMERHARQQAARRPSQFITTQAAEMMGTMIRLADKLCCMLAIVGASGIGKTRVLRHFCDETNGVFVTVLEGMRPRYHYRAIAEALGIHRDKASAMELLNLIIDKLVGSKRILFVDEAHLLQQHVGCLRPIFDIARIPIVMAGAGEILAQIDADRNSGNGQLSSRCMRCDLTRLAMREGSGKSGRRAAEVLFTQEEIAKFFAMKQMRITRAGLQLMFKLANLPHRGHLRLVENLADTIFNSNPALSAITEREVIGALSLMAGDLADALLRDADEMFEAPAAASVAKAG